MSKILYIINPFGCGGAGIKVWEKAQSKWPELIDSQNSHITERQGHAREIATSAESYDILAAVGGDGTVGEIMSGIMALSEPRPKLAIIPAGTGNQPKGAARHARADSPAGSRKLLAETGHRYAPPGLPGARGRTGLPANVGVRQRASRAQAHDPLGQRR